MKKTTHHLTFELFLLYIMNKKKEETCTHFYNYRCFNFFRKAATAKGWKIIEREEVKIMGGGGKYGV